MDSELSPFVVSTYEDAEGNTVTASDLVRPRDRVERIPLAEETPNIPAIRQKIQDMTPKAPTDPKSMTPREMAMLIPLPGQKRSHAEANENADSDIELEGGLIDKNCDQVRRMINTFIEAGEMRIGEFQKAIGVSSTSYGTFMRKHGAMQGANTATYQNAWEFFKKRELKGIPMPRKKRASTGAGAGAATAAAGGGKAAASAAAPTAADVAEIRLPGEDADAVEVYDSCDEIRKKIGAHLRKEGVTQAQLIRDLNAQIHTKPTKIQSNMLNAFRGKKGADAGNTSSVFYAGYCFFEKQRVRDNKPKSAHRLDMERVWMSEGGFDRERGHGGGYFCSADHVPVMNALGQVRTVQSAPRRRGGAGYGYF